MENNQFITAFNTLFGYDIQVFFNTNKTIDGMLAKAHNDYLLLEMEDNNFVCCNLPQISAICKDTKTFIGKNTEDYVLEADSFADILKLFINEWMSFNMHAEPVLSGVLSKAEDDHIILTVKDKQLYLPVNHIINFNIAENGKLFRAFQTEKNDEQNDGSDTEQKEADTESFDQHVEISETINVEEIEAIESVIQEELGEATPPIQEDPKEAVKTIIQENSEETQKVNIDKSHQKSNPQTDNHLYSVFSSNKHMDNHQHEAVFSSRKKSYRKRRYKY